LESPAPPSPLNIAILAPTKTKEKERGLREESPVCYCLA
jgi:hypothetical protein